MSGLPAWYPDPNEPKPAPMPLLLVQAFMNTADPDTGTDLLGDLDLAKTWFAGAGLLRDDHRLRPAELASARRLRDGFHALITPEENGSNRDGRLNAVRELVAARRPQLLLDADGTLVLENPKHDILADGLFELLLIIRAAQENGSWARLKACANSDCRWVYYDRSRNLQGSWCDMAACGNRLKNRRLRARRR